MSDRNTPRPFQLPPMGDELPPGKTPLPTPPRRRRVRDSWATFKNFSDRISPVNTIATIILALVSVGWAVHAWTTQKVDKAEFVETTKATQAQADSMAASQRATTQALQAQISMQEQRVQMVEMNVAVIRYYVEAFAKKEGVPPPPNLNRAAPP